MKFLKTKPTHCLSAVSRKLVNRYSGLIFFSGLKFHNYLICVQSTGMINHVFRSFFAVQIYSLTFFTIYGYITNSQSDQLPDGSIVQLVQHCTGIAEVMNWNPDQA